MLLNHRGGRLSARAASAVFTAILQRAGLDDASAHILRHTFATTMVRGGVDLVVAPTCSVTRVSTRPAATPCPPLPTGAAPSNYSPPTGSGQLPKLC